MFRSSCKIREIDWQHGKKAGGDKGDNAFQKRNEVLHRDSCLYLKIRKKVRIKLENGRDIMFATINNFIIRKDVRECNRMNEVGKYLHLLWIVI